jgi:hypothetical protein
MCNPRKRQKTTSRSTTKVRRLIEPRPRARGVNELICTLLANCRFTSRMISLSERQLKEVQIAADCLIAKDCRLVLQTLLPKWQEHSLLGHHALSLPSLGRQPQTAAMYLQILRSATFPNRKLELRFAQTCFYIIYQGLCHRLRTTGAVPIEVTRANKRIATIARDQILQCFYGDKFKSISQQDLTLGRQSISSILRWGSRWWKIASCIGLGILLLYSEDVAVKM